MPLHPAGLASGAPWSRRATIGAAGALALLAAVIRALARPGRPMWFDEAVTLDLARAPSQLLHEALTHGEANGGLFTLLVRAALLLGDGVGADELLVARLVSTVAGVLAVPALFLAARRLVGDRPALLAALLLAASRTHVHYSLEARGYSLAVLLVILSTWSLVALLDGAGPGMALTFGLLAGLATWTHLFGALVLAAQAGAAVLHPAVRGPTGAPGSPAVRRDLAIGLLVAVIGSATVALLAVRGDVGQVTWIPVLSWPQVAATLVTLAGHARALFLPAVAGLVVVAATARRGGDLAFGPALAAAWFLVPLGLAVAISAVKPLLVPRYLLVAQPGFLLLVALGLCALRRPRLIALAALLALALEGRELLIRPRTRDPLWQPIDEVAARLIEVSRPGDALVVNHRALARSLDREFRRLGRGPGPERVAPPPGQSSVSSTAASLESLLAGRTGALFVLFAEQPDAAAGRAAFARTGRITVDEDRGGIRLLRLER